MRVKKRLVRNIAMGLMALAVLFALLTIIISSFKGETMNTPAREIAVFETSMGNFEVELNRSAAPITVENFVNYVNSSFYDGLVFHRVISNFMVQGGGFSPDGRQKQTKAPIKLESGSGLSNKRGTIAMARTNVPDSATAQFFINVVDNNFLDATVPGRDGYAVFGRVISGMDVVDKIRAVRTGQSPMPDWPVENVVIKKAYLKN